MRTTIDIPDQLMKAAKKRAIEEGITLKELFTRTLEKELQKEGGVQQAPWKELHGKGSAKELKPEDSGFDDYTGPDWTHALQENDPSS